MSKRGGRGVEEDKRGRGLDEEEGGGGDEADEERRKRKWGKRRGRRRGEGEEEERKEQGKATLRQQKEVRTMVGDQPLFPVSI